MYMIRLVFRCDHCGTAFSDSRRPAEATPDDIQRESTQQHLCAGSSHVPASQRTTGTKHPQLSGNGVRGGPPPLSTSGALRLPPHSPAAGLFPTQASSPSGTPFLFQVLPLPQQPLKLSPPCSPPIGLWLSLTPLQHSLAPFLTPLGPIPG